MQSVEYYWNAHHRAFNLTSQFDLRAMDNLDQEFDPELIIGIVSAVGTENKLVVDLLEERLGRAGYKVETVKVSRDVISLLGTVPDSGSDQYLRISSLMDAGNDARSKGKSDDAVLAHGVATIINLKREGNGQGGKLALPKTAFIVDSLKRPEEVARLRLIYPSGFILIGVHSDENRRKRHLVQDLGMQDAEADKLIQRDQNESTVPHGQRVNDTFHLADFFVRISDNRDQLRSDVQRMVELWFGNPFITPTFDEHAMFLAFSAALRSADLSRQVGAVVTRDSQILSTGANDCPKSGGGLYWPVRNQETKRIEDTPGGRDFTTVNGDSNRAQQNRLIDEIVAEVQKQSDKEQLPLDAEVLKMILKNSGIRDLTEYGRVVHAEMEALLSCARNGQSTVGTTLFSTTFPCHNCAKHIIAAGVSRVVYVEPYSKSKAIEFHADSIETSCESPSSESKKVCFEAFVGIGPRRFFELFSMNLGSSYELRRKVSDSGRRKDWSIEKAQLRLQMKPVSYLELESVACEHFDAALSSRGMGSREQQ